MSENFIAPGEFISENLCVISFLGSGGMSQVYKCEDSILSRVVAVKTLRAGFSEETLRRFQTEVKAIARLDHPNIVKLYGMRFGLHSEPILVMEYVDGISLAALLEKEGALPISRSLRIALQIAEGLTAAQKQDITHRDLKPANIMVINAGALDERIKILDFGIAKIHNDASVKATQTGDVFGTPQYMSPEQALGKACDGRADQYSLGCVLFEMISGRPPFEHDNLVSLVIAHAKEKAPSLKSSMNRQAKENPSRKLETLIATLLQKEPEDRYESMYDVGQAIFQVTTHSEFAVGRIIGVVLALVTVVVCVSFFGFKSAEVKTNAIKPADAQMSMANAMSLPLPDSDSASSHVLPPVSMKMTSRDLYIADHWGQFISGKRLDLSGQRGVSDALLYEVAKQKFLTEVNLRKCHGITTAGVNQLRGLRLNSINLSETDVGDDVGEVLAAIPTLNNVDLNVCDIGTKACVQIGTLPNLATISLRAAAGMEPAALMPFSANKTLVAMDLAKLNVKGGIKYLKDVPLKALSLSDSPLRSADFSDGLAAMHDLEVLYVDETGMTRDELLVLSKAKNLKRIRLTITGALTEQDMLEFHKRLPQCAIEVDKPEVIDISHAPRLKLTGPELVKNGDFEKGNLPEHESICESGSKKLPDWTVTRGSIRWTNSGEKSAEQGRASVSLNGTGQGWIKQIISTVPGKEYCLSFRKAYNFPSKNQSSVLHQAVVVFAGLNSNVFGPDSTPGHVWTGSSFAFTALDKQTPIEFRSTIDGDCGISIDSVSVREVGDRD